jgi:hypothetical protein
MYRPLISIKQKPKRRSVMNENILKKLKILKHEEGTEIKATKTVIATLQDNGLVMNLVKSGCIKIKTDKEGKKFAEITKVGEDALNGKFPETTKKTKKEKKLPVVTSKPEKKTKATKETKKETKKTKKVEKHTQSHGISFPVDLTEEPSLRN